ncbi:hypothetical protein UA38_05545 [Photobacterium kishitanii]|uniref:Carbohydrate deacetylase n=1 Tax=Photobacterium kishitanii TaxID=318456 RepID=A0AAX0Z0I6_9GAMM|nr:carbohydrate deacetylase [Photobacterium kishitanii]KJG11188.1 hypothetical protein UB40_00695 [Photobacterium kishitanii]KJG58717.1 hypothetical protein UA38_05545 [Photobacterium kishitanii]KJG62750.1 hypothetical protein UA42_04465 [Photobacterium kishitanii]KJG66653.1 hypothetical protein UA40_06375 [Photobacterium kishitanii]KJG70992.1 hypothetical protein UA41_04100 [Photobacterium kishitanii]
MKIKVINNADDFGYSNAINYGIIDAHVQGILNSTTIMANMPGFEHAIQLYKQYSTLAIGVHCNLTCGNPLSNNNKLIDESTGCFFGRSRYYETDMDIDRQAIYNELTLQIDRVYAAGIRPTHLDSHHHIHTHPQILPILVELADKYQLPLRNVTWLESQQAGNIFNCNYQPSLWYKNKDILSTNKILIDAYLDKCVPLDNYDDLDDIIVKQTIDRLEECRNKKIEVVEIMWHPAYLDKNICQHSSVNKPRIYELQALLSDKLRDYFKMNCVLCDFSELN